MDKPYLQCTKCKRKYSYDSTRWCCEHCSAPLNVEYEINFSLDNIDYKQLGLWKFHNFLPPIKNKISLGEGNTPIVKISLLNKTTYLKLDYLMPTGSFKDRGSFITISRVLDLGVSKIIEDSSGNAGISIAAYGKYAGLDIEVHGPIDMPRGKVEVLKKLGATVFLMGSRVDAHKRAINRKDGLYIGHLYNPFYLEGMKTVAYELYIQLGKDAFRNIVVPIGSGTLLLGIWRGVKDLMNAGLVDEVKILGVEAAGYEEVYENIYGRSAGYEKTEVADGLRVYNKPRLKEIVDVIRKYGDVTVVDRDMIWLAYDELWDKGFIIEPSSAATYAGAVYGIKSGFLDEPIVIILTGSGLKMI